MNRTAIVTALVGAAQRTRASADLTDDPELREAVAGIDPAEAVSLVEALALLHRRRPRVLDVAVVQVAIYDAVQAIEGDYERNHVLHPPRR